MSVPTYENDLFGEYAPEQDIPVRSYGPDVGVPGPGRSIRGMVPRSSPVLGTKQPAYEAKLVILASGPEEARERVQPIFDAIGQRTMWIGEAAA